MPVPEPEPEPEPEIIIPELYFAAVEALGVNKQDFASFLSDSYVEIKQIVTVWNGAPHGTSFPSSAGSATSVKLSVYPCKLSVSTSAPVMKIITADNVMRFMIPDLHKLPQTNPENFQLISVDIPQEYKQPTGIMGYFANLREGVLFLLRDEQECNKLIDCMNVVRRVLFDWAAHERKNFNVTEHKLPVVVPPPSVMNGRKRTKLLKHLPNHNNREESFGNILNDVAKALVTSRAVSNYWKTEQRVQVSFYSPIKGDWKTKTLRIFIHPYCPELIISDKEGGTLVGVMSLVNYTTTRIFPAKDLEIPGPVRTASNSEHWTTFVDVLDRTEHPFIYFTFCTKEQLIDFQQVIATCVYLKRRVAAVGMSNLSPRQDYGLF